MRIWSLHPALLDRQALVACWRETLLAQAVLAGRTKGYTQHPQLNRFKEQPDPVGSICVYLHRLADEADTRGYHFDRARIDRPDVPARLPQMSVTDGQLLLEWRHLLAKSRVRSPEWLAEIEGKKPAAHPIFAIIPGPVATWERATDAI